MSTVKATNFQNASSATANMVTDASGNVSFGGTSVMSSSFLRNRIINGDMRIDQRSAGASATPAGGSAYYSCDRWQQFLSQNSKYSIQQSTTSPAGFTNSLLATSLSAYSVLAADNFSLSQQIEGFNVADLGWGASGALTVTLSFWVRSSLTGTFGGALANSAVNRSYPFTFTINTANTFEYKTVTVAGDTTGTWLTNNGIGLRVWFSLGSGSTYTGTAGAWAAADYRSATGATSVVGTNGATLYITGVQLEVGTVATPFERQIYNAQLAQCQRYYYRIGPVASQAVFGPAVADTTTLGRCTGSFPVTMRTPPTALEQTGTAGNYVIRTGGTARTCSAVPSFDSATENIWQIVTTVASGQTAGQGGFLRADAIITAYLGWSAEL
jgi:hypothetical protein